MQIDESGWHDLNQRLECHLGKNDLSRQTVRELAAAALAHLAPLLDQLPEDAMPTLIASGRVGSPHPALWDGHWHTQSRTASWRS